MLDVLVVMFFLSYNDPAPAEVIQNKMWALGSASLCRVIDCRIDAAASTAALVLPRTRLARITGAER